MAHRDTGEATGVSVIKVRIYSRDKAGETEELGATPRLAVSSVPSPRIHLPARPRCPYRFLPTVTSLCTLRRHIHIQSWPILGPTTHHVESLMYPLATFFMVIYLPMRPGETLSLMVTLQNEQRIEIPEAEVRGREGKGLRWYIFRKNKMRATHPLALLPNSRGALVGYRLVR